MRIHPSSTPAAAGGGEIKKDLRRLPHVYSKVLELPLPADAHVAAFEAPAAFHFVAPSSGGGGEVRARTVRIHPGVVKVVVVRAGEEEAAAGDDGGMELDRWRSRLPEESCPAMAVAGYVDGQLVVTVPKSPGSVAGGGGGDGAWKCCNGGEISGRLVAVQ